MGTQNQDVIEINGKKYDAVTGRLVTATEPAKIPSSTVAHIAHTNQHPKTGVVLDGFVKKPSQHSMAKREVMHSKKVAQKSHTLMRAAVKKPTAVSSPVQQTSVQHKAQLGSSPTRQKAANHVPKSPLISRYGDVQHRSSVVKKLQPLAVKQPVPTQTNHAPVHASMTTAPVQTVHHTATNNHIEKALAHATAHQNESLPHIKKRKKLAHKLGVTPKAMAVSTSVLAGVLLGGFFAIQNVPNLSVRVAAARAGFDANMPGYKPSGYSFSGPINYSPGQVTITFKSNTDNKAYSVTQRASNWNSDALLSNYVVAENKQYQTYLDRGRTLYIYDGSNATWVDNGVWYQVEGDAEITTDQLVRIAASI